MLRLLCGTTTSASPRVNKSLGQSKVVLSCGEQPQSLWAAQKNNRNARIRSHARDQRAARSATGRIFYLLLVRGRRVAGCAFPVWHAIGMPARKTMTPKTERAKSQGESTGSFPRSSGRRRRGASSRCGRPARHRWSYPAVSAIEGELLACGGGGRRAEAGARRRRLPAWGKGAAKGARDVRASQEEKQLRKEN